MVSYVLCGSVSALANHNFFCLTLPRSPSGTLTAHIIANTGGGRSGLDSNTVHPVLASIHAVPSILPQAVTVRHSSHAIVPLANLENYVDPFRRVYPPSKGARATDPVRNWALSRGCLFNGNVPNRVSLPRTPHTAFIIIIEITTLGRNGIHTDSAMIPLYTLLHAIQVTPISQPFFLRNSFPTSPQERTAQTQSQSRPRPRTRASTAAIRLYADGLLAHRWRARRAVRQGQRRPSKRT